MATLISRATGNFTASGTWETVDSTSELDSNVSTVGIGTSNVDSATFTPGAITVTGIGLKIQARASSPSGTFTVTLRNSTDSVDVASVTVNVSDLPYYATNSLGFGWVFFKFSSSQLLIAGKAYIVRCICSAAGSQVTLWRGATANDMCRVLSTTTTAAPASGSKLIIIGERTGTGTGNSFTVTFDNTATTSFGPTVSGGPPEGIVIGQGGTLNFGTTGSTAYYFKWKGIMHVVSGGTLQVGISGTPIPSTSSATLYMDCVASLDTGIVCDSGGIVTIQGATKTTVATRLTATTSSGGTILTLGSTSGWANGDILGIGPGNTNGTEFATATISTVDSSTQVTLTAGVTGIKRGAAPHFTEIINLTRNVTIRGTSSSLRGYFSAREICSVTTRYAYFDFLGSGYTTGGKMGLDIQPNSTGTFTLEYCAFTTGFNNTPHLYLYDGKTGTVTIRYNVSYSPGNAWIYITGRNFASLTATDNVIIGTVDNSTQLQILYYQTSGVEDYSRNVISGGNGSSNNGILFQPNNSDLLIDITGTFDNIRISYAQATGMSIQGGSSNTITGSINNLEIYNCVYNGIAFSTNSAIDMVLNTPTIHGNGSGQFGGGLNFGAFYNYIMKLEVNNGLFAGNSLLGQNYGFLQTSPISKLVFNNCTFGNATGAYVAHQTADCHISAGTNSGSLVSWYFNNCKFGSTTQFTSSVTAAARSYDIHFMNYNQTANDHRSWYQPSKNTAWITTRDSSIFNTASPSEKVTPTVSNTNWKAKSSSYYTTVNSGSSKTINVYVRKSASGDGAAYTGAQPRLIQKANASIGLTSDVVLATMSASTGTWQQLTGTTASVTADGVIECYVDCDGSAGWINVDDWS